MRLPPLVRTVWIVCVTLMVSRVLYAQADNYDPEYDDEMAAGTIDNAIEDGPAAEDIGTPEPTDNSQPTEETTEYAEPFDEEEAPAAAADTDDAPAPAETGEELLPWDWGGERHLSTLAGPTGLFHVIDATSDEMGTFGIGIHGWFFSCKDYLYLGDKNTAMWSGLTLRVTPWDYIEVFAGLDSRANYNDKIEPELFQTLGDFHIGLKGFYPVLDYLSVGMLFGLEFKNPVGEVNFSVKGTSIPLGLLTTFDASKFNENIPIKAHLNLIYRFDNSAKLVEDLESARGGCGEDKNGDGVPDFDGCLNAVERTALDIDRLDQFRIGIGVEAAFPYVSPLIEYNLDIPVNRQDFVCPRAGANRNAESCMDQEGILGMRQWLTFGVRVLPPIKTLTIDFGVDKGLTGWAPSVHELAAQAHYRIIFGLTYNFDPFVEPVKLPPPAPVPCEAPTEIAPPPETVIVGLVRDAETGAPLFGASVVYQNQGVSAQMTGADGKFTSYPFEPGEVTLEVAMAGYEPGRFQVSIPDPTESTEESVTPDTEEALPEGPLELSLDCPLVRRQDQAALIIRVTSEEGAPLPGVQATITGPDTSTKETDASGEVAFEGTAGEYMITTAKTGFFEKNRKVTLGPGQAATLIVKMSQKPKVAAVELSKERIKIKKKIMFSSGAGNVAPQSFQLLDEVVEVLRAHPEIKLVEIQGHTDNKGGRAVNIKLSQKRADTVRQYLIDEGIDPSRLKAKGYGALRPRAPNITSSGRARNRRVEFHIVENAQ